MPERDSAGSKDPALRTKAPAPRTADPAARAEAPALRTEAPALRTADPALRTADPALRTEDAAARTADPALRTEDAALRTEGRGFSLGQPSLPLQPIADDAWPEKLARLRTDFAGRLTVYRVMAHHPDLVLAWERFRNHIVLENALGRERSEVVILRTGHRWGSIYEWSHHVVRARAIGLTDARIESLRGPLEAMTHEDASLARAVDELIENGRMTADAAAAVLQLAGAEGLLDLIATVGMYSTLAFIVNSFETPIDASVAEALGGQFGPV